MARNKKRRGRPSKLVQRYPSGQPVHSARIQRGETEVQIMSTVVEYRSRMVGEKDARSPYAGYELGRLALAGVVTPRRHRAGYDYARLVDDYQRAMGYPSPFPQGMDIGAARGATLTTEPDSARLKRVSNQYMRALTALSEAGKQATREVREVCVFDRPPMSVDNLRLGLDALAKFFMLPVDEQEAAGYRNT